MRWLLPLLLLVALLAPRAECPARSSVLYPTPPGQSAPPDVLEVGGVQTLFPPLRPGHPAAWLGTDRGGRDSACLLTRGLRRSLLLALGLLAAAALPGLWLGLWLGWHGWAGRLPGELLVIVVGLLLLGRGSFRLTLWLGATLLLARLCANRVETLSREVFIEGAVALGGRTGHLWRTHLLPHLRPLLPGLLATTLGALFLWLMELGALGFYDQGVLVVNFSDGLDPVPDRAELPVSADLGQLVSAGRWAWLETPELLALPALLLTLLTLSLKDLSRASLRRVARPQPVGTGAPEEPAPS